MSRNPRIAYPNPPLAGRPPFATDEPDSIYQTGPSAQDRYRQQPPKLDERTSAYNAFDDLFNDSSEQEHQNPFRSSTYVNNSSSQTSIPLAAPRPGYAAPLSALSISPPEAAAKSDERATRDVSQMRTPISAVPSKPHPLQPPMTPITPAFARPYNSPSPRDVKFSEKSIIRGDQEETLLPRRGEKGDDFWRRFSMVVQNETKSKEKSSIWLRKTQNGDSRWSIWVWIIGLFLVALIGGAIFLAWYLNHNQSASATPVAVGGKLNEPASGSSSSLVVGNIVTSSVQHVSPTLTVNYKREPVPSGILEYQVHQTHRHHRRFNPNRIYSH